MTQKNHQNDSWGFDLHLKNVSELESHLLPESSYLKSLSLKKKKKNCIPTGTA